MTTGNEYRIEILEADNARLRAELDAAKDAWDTELAVENARLRERNEKLEAALRRIVEVEQWRYMPNPLAIAKAVLEGTEEG